MIEFLESLLKYKLELLISILLDFNVNKITFVYFMDGKCVLVQSSELAVIYLFPIYSENLIGAKKERALLPNTTNDDTDWQHQPDMIGVHNTKQNSSP